MRYCPKLSHGDVVEFLLLHILQHFSREPLYQLQDWAAQHDIQRFYDGCPSDAFNDDRIGRALDEVAAHAEVIYDQVVCSALEHYRVNADVLHWDLTHIAFTDARRETELVRPGYGDGQIHERQVKLGLHVTSDGSIPVHYEALPGNAQQAPRAREVLQQVQQRLQRRDVTIVSDRGGIGYEIIANYAREKAHFVSCLQLTEQERERVAAVPLSEFTELSYRSSKYPDAAFLGYETTWEMTRQKHAESLSVSVIIVHSVRKQQTDAQERQKRIASVVARLEKVRSQLNVRQFARADYVRKVVVKKVAPTVRPFVGWEVTGPDGALELNVWIDEQAVAQAARSDGRYVVAYDLPEGQAGGEAFEIYKRQGLVEARFRNMNTDLAISPVWLHKDERIVAMVLIYMIALLVYAVLDLLATRAGLDTEYYHRMTTAAMLRRFAYLNAELIRAPDHPPRIELELSLDQHEVLEALHFPDPTQYLHQRPTD